jgi:hypothetical protein
MPWEGYVNATANEALSYSIPSFNWTATIAPTETMDPAAAYLGLYTRDAEPQQAQCLMRHIARFSKPDSDFSC